jgi:hypothetical protein
MTCLAHSRKTTGGSRRDSVDWELSLFVLQNTGL